MEESIIKKIITVDADSIEIGTAKLGKLKIYGDFNKKSEFKNKIECAIELREFAITKIAN